MNHHKHLVKIPFIPWFISHDLPISHQVSRWTPDIAWILRKFHGKFWKSSNSLGEIHWNPPIGEDFLPRSRPPLRKSSRMLAGCCWHVPQRSKVNFFGIQSWKLTYKTAARCLGNTKFGVLQLALHWIGNICMMYNIYIYIIHIGDMDTPTSSLAPS